MAAATQLPNKSAPIETTLLELVQLLEELTEDDQLVVATVCDLLKRGEVRLIGNFRDERLAVS